MAMDFTVSSIGGKDPVELPTLSWITAAVKPAALLPRPLVVTDSGASWATYLKHWL